MASFGKKGVYERSRGRPARGALSSYTASLRQRIQQLRQSKPGWGAASIVDELVQEDGFDPADLPSLSSVHRYLREKGMIPEKTSPTPLPQSSFCEQPVSSPHEVWQMDAQGPVAVKGLGHQAMVNIKDVGSKVHCMALPVAVKHARSQPSSPYYYWTLRLAFLEWGLPQRLQLDKGGAFYENHAQTPFPKHLHLWLIGLGVEVCFITQPPPMQNAEIERSHRTMERQVLQGQSYTSWQELFAHCHQRRKRLNTTLGNRMLGGKAPLQCFPEACHSKRPYAVEQEGELIDRQRIYAYLAQCEWYRKVSTSQCLSLGGQLYYLPKKYRSKHLQITFCSKEQQLIFRDAKELIVAKKPIKKMSNEDLMAGNVHSLKAQLHQLKTSSHCPLIK